MADWWKTQQMLARVADAVRAGQRVLVVCGSERHCEAAENDLRATGTDMTRVEFATPDRLDRVRGLTVDRIEVDEYARVVARRDMCDLELARVERTVKG